MFALRRGNSNPVILGTGDENDFTLAVSVRVGGEKNRIE